MFSFRKLWRPLLLIIVLLAFGLRMFQLDNFGFWLDEGLTPLRSGYSVAEILSNRITIQDGVTKDTHPPLHYLLIHFSRRLFGESDLAYRVPSVFAGVILVPLLFQLARRMDRSKTALLAAFLAAINPLQVWYAQEARMYTLLVLLSAAATLALWRALTEERLGRWLGIYIVCAGLAFYTHYTAIFLIGAQSLFWYGLLWRRGRRHLLIGSTILGLVILAPLIPVTVPRLFAGTEASYFYVSPLIMLQDVIHGFGLGRTVSFRQVSIRMLDVGAGLLLLLGSIAAGPNKNKRLSSAFLLTYLLAAVVGLMLGSLIKPMYMGVRHIMVGSPAFLLLVARGLASLVRIRPNSGPRWLRSLPPLVGVGVVLAGPIISLNNLYLQPDFAKDDVRALIAYVDERAGGNDLILYNDAIQLPLQWHYQQRADLAATALPAYPYSAGKATVAQLDSLSDRYDRIWFIGNLPADGRDDGELVKQWLSDHLTVADTFSAHGHNLEVKVTAYKSASRIVDNLPAEAIPLNLGLDRLALLRGLSLDFEQPADLPTLWIDLFWQGGPVPEQRQLRFALRGPDQDIWLDHSGPFFPGKNQQWSETGLVRLSYHLPVPAGMPPGEFGLMLLAWDKESDQNSDEWQTLARIELADSSSWPLDPARMIACRENRVPCDGATTLRFANGMSLLGLSYGNAAVRPGHPVPLTLYWQASSPPGDDLEYQIQVVGPQGEILRTVTGLPGADWLTADSWPLGTVVREQTGLYFPPDTAPGQYKLRWSLSSGKEPIPVRPAWRPWHSEHIILGKFFVEPWPLVTALPAVSEITQAQVGPSIELYGYELEETALVPGDILDLSLFWRAVQVPDRSYYVFVHLVRADDGSNVSQLDRVPVDWLRPTNGWRPGEVLSDVYHLPVPEELAPGTYLMYVGMFNPDSWQRLPITYRDEEQPDARLLLATWVYE